MDATRIRLAITLGDPRGIGPEVAAAAASELAGPARPRLIFVGPSGTGAERAADRFIAVGQWNAGGSAGEAGALAGRAVERAVDLVLHGEADALVTAPIDKSALNAGGFPYPGHTEMLAHLTGRSHAAMMLTAESTPAGPPLRVLLVTTHVRLAAVPGLLSRELVERQARLAAGSLRALWRIDSPRLALCALNPHASDGGLFGDEEERILIPAVDGLRGEGMDISGPLSADTVFVRALRGEFDVVLAPYHDVGMAAFKTAAFGAGVNVTLGLPILRTSPDHGTALDLAGRGRADPSSMREAMRLAQRLAGTGPEVVVR